jgi:hypothetical protein
MRAHGPLVCGLWLVLLATSACGGSGTGATETDPPVIVATTRPSWATSPLWWPDRRPASRC